MHIRLTALALLGYAVSLPVSAATVEYTSASGFDAAVTAISGYNFNGIVAPEAYQSETSPVSVGPAAFSTTSPSDMFLFDANATGGTFGRYGTSYISIQNGAYDLTSTLSVTLSGSTAVAFDVGSYIQSDLPITVTVNGTTTFQITTPATPGTSTTFVGFTSTTPITGVTFSTPGIFQASTVMDVTGFETASAAPVPLPASVWLMLSGVIAMGAMVRMRET